MNGARAVHGPEVRNLIMRLFRDGQLEREPEIYDKTKTRYRYGRRRALEGPIAELEQAYNDDVDGGEA